MGFIGNIFNTIFYEPLLNGLVFLINILPLHDVGMAVVVLTVIVRFIIFPLSHKTTINQIKIKQLEPKLKEIKEKFKNDSQEQAKKTMELYRIHGINPFSSFITLLIQIPIIIALYRVFMAGINFDPSHLYSFVKIPESINVNFLGLFNMTEKSYVLGFLTGLSQFIQMRLALPPIKKTGSKTESFKDELARNMNVQMRYVMPVIAFFIASRFISAIAVYWTTMNIFAIIHEAIVRKKAKRILNQNGNFKPDTDNKITGGRDA